MAKIKNEKNCTKIMSILQWSDWCSETSPIKKNVCSDAKRNWKLRNQLKVQIRITNRKNMEKLVLQNKQIWILESYKLA